MAHDPLWHLTLETGHGSLIRPETKSSLPKILRALKPLADRGSVEHGDWTFAAVPVPGGFRFDAGVRGWNGPLVTGYVATKGGGEAVWRQMAADRRSLGFPDVACPRPTVEPWLSAMFRANTLESMLLTDPVAQDRFHEALRAVAVWEQGVAWALLQYGRALATDAPLATPLAAEALDSDPTHKVMRETAARDVRRAVEVGANGTADLQRREAPKLSGTFASAVVAEGTRKGASDAARVVASVIRSCARLSLDALLIDQADALKIDWNILCGGWGQLLRLPHDPVWLEAKPIECAFAQEAGPQFVAERTGYLVCSESEGFSITYAFCYDGTTIVMPGRILVSPEGVTVEAPDRRSGELLTPMADSIAERVIQVFLLLNARNAPVEVGDAEDVSKLNRKRAQMGRPPVLSTAPVRWDLSRIERRAKRQGEAFGPEQRRQAVAALVRGHVKVRKTGAFWWSPYVRSGIGPDPRETGRDYVVRP
ncbi:hypothetical protein [Azospirillum brasilense]|uniref:Uncharacterized protein n=1 Tax=Azospirillum brasilense TaxID=192 RepID=A0A6L3AR51_AZOBR|nr:hypothetical protein [Azospirillum brasilense]KAA0676536.1 hypothetical protein DS837_30730 [Azospirillum brasilense]